MNYSRKIIKVFGIILAVSFSIQSSANNTSKITGNSPETFTIGSISLGNKIAEIKAREIVLSNGEIIQTGLNENVNIGNALDFCRKPHQEQINEFKKTFPEAFTSNLGISDFYKLNYKIVTLLEPYNDVNILLNSNNSITAITVRKKYSDVAEGVVIDAIFDRFGDPKYIYKKKKEIKSIIFTDINFSEDKLDHIWITALYSNMNDLLQLLNNFSSIEHNDNITPLKGNHLLIVSASSEFNKGVAFMAIKDYQPFFDELRSLRRKCVTEFKIRLDKLEEDTIKNAKPFNL
ncbi:hypothetical protein [Shewanella psychrotolerans]|uniref:hypothetical protein n=1 Tax=Shewanella psychrotolerans TaxID=2864206 RepID=UPI001C65E686|nr:hypothetical protein [Shewanella psychrotolerans]QYJ99753.1 hypothetical protein K0I62_09725 [Shewanella psychrotolerans]